MEKLIAHFIENDKKRMSCENVILGNSFLKEFCNPSNSEKQIQLYKDLLKLIAINATRTGKFVELYSIKDLYDNLEKTSSRHLHSGALSPIDIANGKKFLDLILAALNAFFTKTGDSIRPLNQEEILPYFKNEKGEQIGQAAFSNRIRRNKPAMIDILSRQSETYELIMQTLTPFRRHGFIPREELQLN